MAFLERAVECPLLTQSGHWHLQIYSRTKYVGLAKIGGFSYYRLGNYSNRLMTVVHRQYYSGALSAI